LNNTIHDQCWHSGGKSSSRWAERGGFVTFGKREKSGWSPSRGPCRCSSEKNIFSALQKNEEYLRRSEELAREWGERGAVRVHLEKERKELLALLEGEQSARETSQPSRTEAVGQLLADRDPQPSERLVTCFPLWKQLGKTEDIERLVQGISIKDIPPPEIQRNNTEQEREARTVAYLAEKQKILSQKIDRRFGSHPIVHISIGSLGRKLSESFKTA
jgi:hypothetical protein